MIRGGLTGRDVLHQRDDAIAREDRTPAAEVVPAGRLAVEEAAWSLDDGPRGDLAALSRPRGVLSRLDARTRSLLAAAAVAAVLVNAGAAWAYWHITGSATGPADAGAVVELNLRGGSDMNTPLAPGSTGNLTVTVTNDNDFPIRITSIAPAPGAVLADEEHRENGCVAPGVTVARDSVRVRWNVARNNVAAFTVPDGLAMSATSDPACAGAVFTVPLLAAGIAGVS